MRVEIIPPKHIGYFTMVYRTRAFFHSGFIGKVYADSEKRFYIFFSRKGMCIRSIDDTCIKKVICDYLECIFSGSYIGLPKDTKEHITLQNVEVLYV